MIPAVSTPEYSTTCPSESGSLIATRTITIFGKVDGDDDSLMAFTHIDCLFDCVTCEPLICASVQARHFLIYR